MERSTYEVASRVGQGAVSAYNPSLAVDGKWGSFSQRAYEGLNSAQRLVVDAAVRATGVTVEQLSQFRVAEKARAASAAPAGNNVAAALRTAAEEAGLPYELLRGFVSIESNFDPNARNGSSRGLGQMQPAAWTDAQKINPSIPSYDMVFDPLQNARATAAYMKANIRALSRMGIERPTAAQLYMAHQQGAAGFAELYAASRGQKPKTNYVTAERMLKNPPQDGKGKTTDKALFYARWIEVANRKIRV